MGFLKGIKRFAKKVNPVKISKRFIKNPVKASTSLVKKAVNNPFRYGAAVFSGGATEILRQAPGVGKVYATTFDQLYVPIAKAYADKVTFGGFSLGQGLTTSLMGEKKMGFNVGKLLGSVGGILGNTNVTGNPYVAGLGGALSLVGSATMKRPRASSAPIRTSAAAAAATVNAVASPTGLTRDIFNAGSKVLSRLGVSYPASQSGFSSALRRSLGSIASLARRTPAGTIVSILAGLGLTALESYMLTAWYSQRRKGRRMNPANARALRRAARRIRSFHKLCTHTDLLKTRGRSRSVGRCGSCRKNPCSC